jgi:DNA polymerase-3 subunit delta'
VSDVFSDLVGVDEAVAVLRGTVRNPVQAYLLTGSSGSPLLDGARRLAAALVCAEAGCGRCDDCRQALAGIHADVTEFAMEGSTWRVDDIHEMESLTRRYPLGRRRVNVIPRIDLTSLVSIPALLKVLEEPPSRSSFILTTESFPDHLATVRSRSFELRLPVLTIEAIAENLERSGVASLRARMAAENSGGDLARARLLAADEGLEHRIAMWRSVPEALTPRLGSARQLATAILAAVDSVLEPKKAQQRAEWASLEESYAQAGMKRPPGKSDFDKKCKRELAALSRSELDFGLATLARVYRESLLGHLEGEASAKAKRSLEIVALINEAHEVLATNVNTDLLLTTLFARIART